MYHELVLVLVLFLLFKKQPALLLNTFLVIDSQCPQFPVEMGALHANPLGKLADTAANFPQLVQKIVMLELLACLTQWQVIGHLRTSP